MNDIDHSLFRRLDLNLLVAFDALVTESSVTRAASRLCIGQPAMSHALGRLRELFQDDILYREGAAMQPTGRALALAPAVRELLLGAHRLALANERFDPARVEEQFRIALNDPLEALLLPALMARLRAEAPGLLLSVRPIPASRQLDELDAGTIRLAVGHFPRVRAVHEQIPLHDAGFCCVCNPALISLPEQVRLEDLVDLPHIHTSYTGDAPGMIDRALQQRGLRRRIVAHAATPLSIPFVVRQSPLVAVVPELVSRLFLRHGDLRILPLALDDLHLPISAVFHRRDSSDPLAGFMRDTLLETAHAVLAEDTGAEAHR
ncbi:LysR substrate-binding domain-containing protein [Uliginosibacterium paludis]|uniref:LysR substrate-binding domain-containing protein n=1 Tax=Uliginosibacterium paludis TaxID=1615952 RepID=A0ABV2CSU3_9RHOO